MSTTSTPKLPWGIKKNCKMVMYCLLVKMLQFSFNMARKSIGRRKMRAILTIIGIVIGIATIISLVTLGDSTRYEVEINLNDMLGAGITVSGGNQLQSGVTIPEHVKDYVLQIPGVKDCVPIISSLTQIGGRPVFIIGANLEHAAALYHVTLSQGRFPAQGETYKVIMSESMATRLSLSVNDTITLTSPVSGFSASFAIIGIGTSSTSNIMDVGCYISLEDAQRLANKPGYVSSLLVILEDTGQAQSVEVALETSCSQVLQSQPRSL